MVAAGEHAGALPRVGDRLLHLCHSDRFGVPSATGTYVAHIVNPAGSRPACVPIWLR